MDGIAGIILNVWEWIYENALPWVIVQPGEKVILYFLGRPKWTLSSGGGFFGLYLYLPFLCSIEVVSTMDQIAEDPGVVVRTSDQKLFAATISVAYKVEDPIVWVTGLAEGEESLLHYARGILIEQLAGTHSADLADKARLRGLCMRIENRLYKVIEGLGGEVLDVNLALAPTRSITLFSG